LQDDIGRSGAPSINSGLIFFPGKINLGEIYIPAIFMHVVRMQRLSLSADVRVVIGFFPLKLAAF
jgi:hypothetical protein